MGEAVKGESSAQKLLDLTRLIILLAMHEIPFGDVSQGKFNPDEWMSSKDRRKVDDFILYGICAADQAVRDAGWAPDKEEDLLKTGVMIGSGIGGLQSIGDTANLIKERDLREYLLSLYLAL